MQAQRSGTIRTVVIDAGHGGHDPGALGKQTQEKKINLAIALKLGKMIQASLPDVKVIYTRDKDFFVELYRRANIANESKADIFISIHCNANKNPALKGAETYVMGLHKSQANLNIAKLENAAILFESDYQSAYNGFDPNSDESYIIFSLNQNSNLGKSTEFAASIQQQMTERVGLNDRGVRQAGFLVLYKTTMPSVLVETGYLSNPEEEKFLISAKGQDYIATAIYRAFKEIAVAMKVSAKTGDQEKRHDSSKQETARNENSQVDPETVLAKPAVKSDAASKNGKLKPASDESSEKLSYRVQIATEKRNIGVNAPKFGRFSDVRMYRHGGMYKYTVGNEADMAGVLRLLADVKAKGVKDAFIVIFRNEQRIPQTEADKLMRK